MLLKDLEIHREVLARLERKRSIERERRFVEQNKIHLAQLGGKFLNMTTATTIMASNIPLRLPTLRIDEKRRPSTNLERPAMNKEMVPIKLDLDTDGYKLRDSLLWNVHETSLTVEEFALMTCRDFDLPLNTFVPLIAKTMQTQIEEYRDALAMIKNAGGIEVLQGIRIIIKLDITVGFLQLADQFEWDLGERRNDPVAFASNYCKELGIASSGEFVTAVAIDIIEQVLNLRRTLLIVGFHKDPVSGNVKVNDPEVQTLILPTIKATARRAQNSLNDYSPLLTEFDPLELERLELSRDREARRKRRQNRGRRGEVVSITRVEPPKTIRTPLSYRGSLHRVLSKLEDNDDGTTDNTSRSTTRSRRSRK